MVLVDLGKKLSMVDCVLLRDRLLTLEFCLDMMVSAMDRGMVSVPA